MNELHIDKTHWKKYRFDEMVQNVSERVEPSQTDLDMYVGLEHIDPDTLHLSRHGHPSDVEGTKLRFYKGDIIFGRRRAYQRKTALATTDGICSAHAIVVRAKEDVVDPMFLPFLFHSKNFIDMAITISVGGLSPTINWKDIAKQEFLLPPKAEQKRLAELLWAADEVVEKEKMEKERMEMYKTSVCNDFFKTIESYKPIKSFGNVFTGSTPSTKILKYWNGEYHFLTPTEINNTLEPQTASRFVTIEGLKASREISSGDVLVTCVGEIGRITIASKKCCANQQINVISPNNTIDSKYLFYSLKQYKNLLLKATTISVVPILVKSSFENIQLPDFPINKKGVFVKQMDDIEQQIEKCSILLEQSQQIKQELINKLF